MRKDTTGVAGKVFHELLAIKEVKRRINKQIAWQFKCSCGRKIVRAVSQVMRGHVKSCGCFRAKRLGESRRTHGLTGTLEYKRWRGIKSRCLNKRLRAQKKFRSYRHVKICKRWLRFENFLKDMGGAPRPELTIDRIDNSKGYCKSNCRWATRAIQSQNRTNYKYLTYKGYTFHYTEWAQKLGIRAATLKQRLNKYKWSVKKSLTHPVRSPKLSKLKIPRWIK